jgi:AcrR family transcriptional regulator
MSVLARRTYKPADERREQILDCALEVFAKNGYHTASIADICAKARIGRATLYQYFEDKRDVLVALADRIARRVIEAVEARPPLAIPDGFRPTERQMVRFIEARCVEILRVVFDDARATRLILRAGRGADGVVDEILARIDATLVGVLERDLDEAQRLGVIRPLDTALVARFFLGGLEKVVLSHVDEDRTIDVAHLAREVALVETCGVFARRPKGETR